MAGFNGRDLTIDWDDVTLVGVRTRGINRNKDLVDVTTDDDGGWRKLLATPGVQSVEVTVAGITSDEVLLAEFYNALATGETLTVNLPSALAVPGSESGNFLISALETSAEHDGAVEFNVTFMSDGEVTYTASAAS
jgi:TP901-1 family phage major tail protein